MTRYSWQSIEKSTNWLIACRFVRLLGPWGSMIKRSNFWELPTDDIKFEPGIIVTMPSEHRSRNITTRISSRARSIRVLRFFHGYRALAHPAIVEAANLDPTLRLLVVVVQVPIAINRCCCLLLVGFNRSRQPLDLGFPRIMRGCQSFTNKKKKKTIATQNTISKSGFSPSIGKANNNLKTYQWLGGLWCSRGQISYRKSCYHPRSICKKAFLFSIDTITRRFLSGIG